MSFVSVVLTGDWAKAKEITGSLAERFKIASERAVMQEAHMIRGEIVKGIREGAPGGKPFKPLAPSTLATRAGQGFKGTKPLIERGDLRNSIVVKKIGDGAFIGVLRTAKSKAGKAVANIAEMMEFGAGPFIVPITDKSRRFYHAMLAKSGIEVPSEGEGGHTVAIIRIPARPFIRPVFEKFAKPQEIRDRFYARVWKMLNG